MSRIKLLVDLADELRSLAQTLDTIADSIGSSGTPAPAAPDPTPEPQPEPQTKPVTLEQVRAVLAEKSHDGLTAEVRTLLQKYGADKLSAVDPKHYPALMADAEVLGHAT